MLKVGQDGRDSSGFNEDRQHRGGSNDVTYKCYTMNISTSIISISSNELNILLANRTSRKHLLVLTMCWFCH